MTQEELAKLAEAPDYEKIYVACGILAKYVDEQDTRRLNPDHDIIYLCFYVPPKAVSKEDRKVLEACDVDPEESFGCWSRFTSC